MEKAREALGSTRFPGENVKFGSYLLESVIDEDKSGRLFKAIDENLARPACLKILSPELSRNPSFVDVLRIQMQAAASLNDAGIVPLYEIGQAEGFCYIATEWSPVGLLSQEVIANGKLPLTDALDLIIKCAQILESAAEVQLFHGNLRLNSIVLYPAGQIKISEMGFVAGVRALYGATNLAVYLGAARFLSPEITSNGPVDHRADIYSLGLILYFLLFSVTPFRYEGEKLTEGEETIETDYMEDVLKIVSRMTESHPGNRYQDYHSLLKDLKALYDRSAPSVNCPVIKNYHGAAIKNQKLFKLLCVVFASAINGALTVTQGETQRTFFVRNREIVYYESSNPQESIWEWLVEKKELDAKHKPSAGESFQRVLNRIVAKEILKLEDFKFRYQELVNRSLAELLKNPSASAEFTAADVVGQPLCTVRLSGLLLKAARYTIDFQDVLGDIKSDTFLYRTPLFDDVVTGFTLTDEENLLAQVSQDGIFTGSLKVTSGSSAEKGLRFLYLLKQIGALEVKSSEPAPVASTAPDASPLQPEQEIFDEFQLDEPPKDDLSKSDAVRMEIQRTATKADRDRLDQEAERRYAMAKDFYANGKYWEAAHYCEQALGLHEDGRYYWLMGLSYAQHPRFRHKAEDSFHRALKLDPLNDELHADLAEFYVAQGLFLRARSHAKKALEIIPDHIRAGEILAEPAFASLGAGGCCCEHDPGCNHEEHKAWRLK
jgi:hypothetical protein